MELHEFFLLLVTVLLGVRVLSEAAARLGILSVIGGTLTATRIGITVIATTLKQML